MKRREFLAGTSAVAGSLWLPDLARSAPCPPPSLSVSGGTSATTGCGSAESDWVARSTGPGVQWAHDFRTDAEVNNFRWQEAIGNVPNIANSDGMTRRITSDGITGTGCLEMAVPQGGKSISGWWRPFSALQGDVGYTSGMPTWNVNNPSQAEQWLNGYYGHPDYHGTGNFVGTDFYLQFRVKISASRHTGGPWQGKLVYVATMGRTPDQELVIRSNKNRTYDMYTSFGGLSNSFLTGQQAPPGGSNQPGGSYNGSCTNLYGADANSTCWSFPSDQWVTVLIHVIPGHANSPIPPYGDWSAVGGWTKDTGIQVWVAGPGQKTYTKIWDKLDYAWKFENNNVLRQGFNGMSCSAYMNNENSTSAFSHRFTQIIFSRQMIACPQA